MRGRERNLGKDGKRKVEEREFEEKEEEKDLREGVGHLHVKKRGERWGKTGKEDDLGHRCSRDIGAYPGRGQGLQGTNLKAVPQPPSFKGKKTTDGPHTG